MSQQQDVLDLLLWLVVPDGVNTPKTRKNAASALGNLAKSAKSRMALIRHRNGALVEGLLRVLEGDSNVDARRRAARSIRCLSGGVEEGRAFLSLRPSVADSVARVVSNDPDSDVRAQAVETLASLSSLYHVSSLRESLGPVLGILVGVVGSSEDYRCVEIACRAVSNYFSESAHRGPIGHQSQLLNALCRVATDGQCAFGSKSDAARLLRELAGDRETAVAMGCDNAVLDGLSALLALSGLEYERHRSYAAEAVVRLAGAGDESNLKRLAGHGSLIPMFVNFTVTAPEGRRKREAKDTILRLVPIL